MMNPIKSRRVSILAAALFGGSVLLASAGSAQASPTFPPALKAALDTQFPTAAPFCVPQCIACHLTNLGGTGTLNVFGKNLETIGRLFPGDPANVGPAITKYFMTNPDKDSDGDGVSDAMELEAGDSAAIALPRGQNLLCPDVKYGCAGGRIAAAPSRNDQPALFAAGLVVVGLSAAMRRRRRRAVRAR